MLEREVHRPLGRLGARELTPEEIERLKTDSQGLTVMHTEYITVNPLTGSLDGDGA